MKTKVEKCIMNNEKTGRSLDLSTKCPKHEAFEQLRAELQPHGISLGSVKQYRQMLQTESAEILAILEKYKNQIPCIYCYVEAARDNNFNGKKMYDRIEYRGEILRMKSDTIAALNSSGGLRIFSFADYQSWMDADLIQIFQDAKLMGLQLKAITKQLEFVDKFHKHLNIIHISVDNVGCGIDWATAKEYRAKYTNVLVRAAIMATEDVEALNWCDILTFNHAQNGFKRFYTEERSQYFEMYPGKVCCETNKCATCTIKCGQDAVTEKHILKTLLG